MRILFLGLALFLLNSSIASHIVGVEVYYNSLGGDEYEVKFEVYRDCQEVNPLYDNTILYTVFNSNNSIYSEFIADISPLDTLSPGYTNPCIVVAEGACVEKAYYTDTITLPSTVDGYYITYQSCCFPSYIQNIVSPENWGVTSTCSIPGADLVSMPNNCARFNNDPPSMICSGESITLDYSVTDVDGDSIVYKMNTPRAYDNSLGTNADPEQAAPYPGLIWEPGFSSFQPFGAGATFGLDQQTGLLNITPSQLGVFIVGITAEEYRDGQLINSKERSFSFKVVNCPIVLETQVDIIGVGELIEGCSNASFILSRQDISDIDTFQIQISGSAINGSDYSFISNEVVMNVGVGQDTINIVPLVDGLSEGSENVEVSIVFFDDCVGENDTISASMTIVDYTIMEIKMLDSIDYCNEFEEFGMLSCSVDGGIPGYSYDWSPLSFEDNDSIQFPISGLNENLNLFELTVTDQCGISVVSPPIKIYVRCPLKAPNVITANNDGINDLFVLKNLEDYDRLHLLITNRWGNLIYENSDYQNDWNGLTNSGKMLTDGVYFYKAYPEGGKYDTNDTARAERTIHGFVHVVR